MGPTCDRGSGAGATAGPARVAKSPADGYTLLINTSAQAYSAAFLKDLSYDPLKDFIPVAPLTSQPYVLIAGKAGGVTTVAELIAAAKATPGELKFGSTGPGTGSHLGVVKFNLSAGIEAVDIPPQPTDAIADIVSGTIEGRGAQSCFRRCRRSLRRALLDSTSRFGMEYGYRPGLQ